MRGGKCVACTEFIEENVWNVGMNKAAGNSVLMEGRVTRRCEDEFQGGRFALWFLLERSERHRMKHAIQHLYRYLSVDAMSKEIVSAAC